MKLKIHKSIQLQRIAVVVFFLSVNSFNAAACELITTVKDATIDEIRAFFETQNKDVVTFVGYSGAEYEDKVAMLEKAGRILDEFRVNPFYGIHPYTFYAYRFSIHLIASVSLTFPI
ncbi:MAG: hypothetical protein PVI13_12170 [Desulfobacterales bacterium]|mgnify:FL=1|jgi:hypothetical protein